MQSTVRKRSGYCWRGVKRAQSPRRRNTRSGGRTKRSAAPRPFRPHLEQLEDRRLLAINPAQAPLIMGPLAEWGDHVTTSTELGAPIEADGYVADAREGNEARSTIESRPYVPDQIVVAVGSHSRIADAAGYMAAADWTDVFAQAEVRNSRSILSLTREDGEILTLLEVTLAGEIDVPSAIAQIEAAGQDVIWAAPNYIYEGEDPRDLVPNDPQYGSQYHHPLMQNHLAWDTTLGDPGIVVAVTDDGVDLDHEDLAANIWVNTLEYGGIPGVDDDGNGYIDDVNGWDFASGDNDPNPVFGASHGTHVAGIVAAATNNAVGVAGTAGGCTIMPLRFYGSGAWTSTVIADTFTYAANNGADIVSTSYNMDGWASDATVTGAYQYLYDNGVLHLNSAGNSAVEDPPRSVFHQTLLVASTDSSDRRSSFSNYGVEVDVAAPGSSILSTVPDNGYGSMSGTSMAAPNAAAVAALIWSANPTWTRDQVAAQLLGTADNIDGMNPGYEGLLGSGRVNSHRGVTETLAPPRINDVVELPPEAGKIHDPLSTLTVRLGSVFDVATISSSANWELRSDGVDNVFGNGDDDVIPLTLLTTYMIGTNQLEFSVDAPMPYEHYRFRAVSGGLADPFGTALDGNADGVAGDHYDRTFFLETPPVAWERLDPAGSLMYGFQDFGAVSGGGPGATYDTSLDGDQTLSIAALPGEPTATLTLTLSNGGGVVATATSSAPGAPALIQLASTVDDDYSFTLTSDVATHFDLLALLNAAGEEEFYAGGASNDTRLTAQDLDPSFLALPGGGQRGAVVGITDGGGIYLDSQTQHDVVHSPNVLTYDFTGATAPSGDGTLTLTAIADLDMTSEYLTVNAEGVVNTDVFVSGGLQYSLVTTTVNLTQADLATLAGDGVITFTVTPSSGVNDFGPNELTLELDYPAGPVVPDWYGFSLAAGQSATLALAGQSPAAIRLELLDNSETLLASGSSAGNADQVINNFVAPAAGTYYARVTSVGVTAEYNLAVTRSADFDTEANDSLIAAQELSGDGSALGYLHGVAPETPGGGGEIAYRAHGVEEADQAGAGDAEHVPGRLIVRWADSATDRARDDWLKARGATRIHELRIIDGAVVQLADPAADVLEAAARWSESPVVKYAEPDWCVQAVGTFPNDPLFPDLWGMHNTGQLGGTPDADIDAPEAWDLFTGSATVVVADIDTGVDYNHEDLAAAMWVNPGETPGDGIDNDGNGYVDDVYGIDAHNGDSDPWDDNGHGTHTSGTFGGVGDNGIGVAGVNWDVQIMALKFLSSGGSGSTSNAVLCVDYMTMMKTTYGVNVVASSNSWGGGGFSQALKDAIQASNDAGIMFVAAAGNSGSDTDNFPHYPSSYDLEGIIAVAATDPADDIATYGNFGSTFNSSYGATSVDLGAPGVAVLSSIPGDGYASYHGTSMATPHVSGAVAMLMAYNPAATLADVKAAILDGTDPIPALDGKTVTGGRLNLANSLTLIGDLGDYYHFEATAGNTLQLSTGTPGDGPRDFVNLLDPALELYDPSGVLVASDDNSGPDGRNAQLTHAATTTGTYTVRVLSVAEWGEYVVHVSGHTGALPAFEVAATDPADQQRVGSGDAPFYYTVQFNDAVLQTSLSASDLQVDGSPAIAIHDIPQGDTVVFELPAPLAEGVRTVMIAGGAILDVQGTAIEPFTAEFEVDLTAPRVIATTVQEGDIVTGSNLSVDITFNEELKATDLDPSDVSLVGVLTGAHTPDVFSYEPSTSTLTLEFSDLPQDDYTLTLYSGDGQFEDLVGHDLDGEPVAWPIPPNESGNGIAGGDFYVHFAVDYVQSDAKDFERLEPLGGLIFVSPGNPGLINLAADADDFSFFLEGGQTISAVVTPDDPAATLSLQLVGLSGTVPAPAAGEPAYLPPVAIGSDGTYAVRVSGNAHSPYTLEIYRNAAVEVIDSANGAELNVDDTLIDLGSGRYGVIGTSRTGSAPVDAVVWGVRPATSEIIKIDPATGTVLDAFPAPDALAPGHTQIGLSIAEGGDSLLYVNSNLDPTKLYRLDPHLGTILSEETTTSDVIDGLGFEDLGGGAVVIYSANMDTDPGWTLQGEWAYGVPTGGGSHNLDPTAGHTGANVVGYNLSGDYANSIPVYYATTPAFDASLYTDVTLSFYRWLGVESATFDHASIQVSNNGTTWTTVWDHTGSAISDSSWTLQTYDISAVADGQSTVYVRWSMGPTDSSVTYPGWNIDDVVVTGTVPPDPKIFLGHDGADLHRQEGFSGPETLFWATGAPTGGLGGDDAGRQFGYFTDGLIHEYDPATDTNSFLSTLTAPAGDIEGLAFDGANLYASTASGNLYTLNPDTGAVLNVASVPGGGLFGLGAVQVAGSGNLLVNGDFETGDFTGWTVSDTTGMGVWTVNDGTFDPPGSGGPMAPISGNFDALSSSSGSGIRQLTQSFVVPTGIGSAILSWSDRIRNFYTAFVEPSQEWRVLLLDAGGALIQELYSTEPGDPLQQIGPNSRSVDVTALLQSLAGQTVQIAFEEEDSLLFFNVNLDDVAISGGTGGFVLPDVDEYELDLTGKAGQPIDVILAGQDGTDFSAAAMELLDVDGITVLAVAYPDPLGVAADNYALGILDFTVPAGGVYTVRVRSMTEGRYGVVVTDPLTFDSEPNDDLGDPGQPLRSLDDTGEALGLLAGPPAAPGGASIAASDGDFPRGADPPSIGAAPVPQAGRQAGSTGPVVLADYSAFGWEAFNNMLAEFDPDVPEVLNTAAPLTITNYAGDFDNSGDFTLAYVINNNANTLVAVDTSTGAVTTIGPATPYGGQSWTGMAMDPITGVMYGCSTNVTASSLYTIDLSTGAATRIGPITNSPGIIALAVDDIGQVYGHDIVNDSLIRIDKATGAGTIVGPLGFDANFAQGMDFDEVSGQLYLAAYNNATGRGELRIADRATGATTLVGVLGSTVPGGTAEVCWMGVAVSGGRDTGDLYEITLAAGDTVVVSTDTLFDGVQGVPRNDLDPALALYDPSGVLVAGDADTQDGKNARLVFDVTAAGTYTIEVSAESGVGEYRLQTQVVAGPVPWLSINNVSLAEGDSGTTAFTFEVTLSATSTSTVTVDWATSDGTAAQPGDYTTAGGNVSFASGETSKFVTVPVNGDADVEPNETFFVTLSGETNAVVADPHGVGTILNDDTGIESFFDVAVVEGDSGVTTFDFVVRLVAPAGVDVTVDYATSDGSATAGDPDYVPGAGPLTIPAGEIEKAISVPVLADTQVEPHEWFRLDLSNPSYEIKFISDTQAVGHVLNDDTKIAVDDVTLVEGDTGKKAFEFTVSLAMESALPVTVEVSTADGSATVKDGDYDPLAPTLLTFDPGDTSKTVTVSVNGDTKVEGDETFRVNLNNASQPIARAEGIGTVLNDDLPDGLVVTMGAPTASGYVVQFSQPVDTGALSLYDVEAGTFGLPDVTLVGAVVGPVAGSLVLNSSNDQVTFIATGGPLPADTYTLTLRSAADAFKAAATGGLLDGEFDGTTFPSGNGVEGGDFVHEFSVSPEAIVVRLPDFTRGPGQPVNVPALAVGGHGIPVSVSDANGVASIDLTILYDPDLLTITDAVIPATTPSGSIDVNLTIPGKAVVGAFWLDPLPAGETALFELIADVPSSAAPYATAQVLDVEELKINEGAVAATADDAIHAVGYFGDATANGNYSSLDAQRALRVAVARDSGFQSWLLIDPVVIADVTGNGDLSSLDAQKILQKAVGRDVPEIPPLPPPPGDIVAHQFGSLTRPISNYGLDTRDSQLTGRPVIPAVAIVPHDFTGVPGVVPASFDDNRDGNGALAQSQLTDEVIDQLSPLDDHRLPRSDVSDGGVGDRGPRAGQAVVSSDLTHRAHLLALAQAWNNRGHRREAKESDDHPRAVDLVMGMYGGRFGR